MSKLRRKNTFNAKLREKYPFLEKTKSDSDVLCKKCRGTFCIAFGGNADIGRHIKTKKTARRSNCRFYQHIGKITF